MPVLTYPTDFLAAPLLQSLKCPDLKLVAMPESEISKGLEDNTIDLAVISPFTFALIKKSFRIVPEFIISSSEGCNNLLLFFKSGLENVKTIHFLADKQQEFEQVAANIITREFLGLESDWVRIEAQASIAQQLKKNPVLFCTGVSALQARMVTDKYIDLGEEWILKTDLPFVQRIVVAGSRLKIDQNLVDLVSGIRKEVSEHLRLDFSLFNLPEAEKRMLNEDFEHYRFAPTSETWDGLSELLQYMFYYGYTSHIPQIQFV